MVYYVYFYIRRNQNYLDILRGLSLGQSDGFDISLAFHHVFWLGDLNYRLDREEEVNSIIIFYLAIMSNGF